jgi:hypothetical protein
MKAAMQITELLRFMRVSQENELTSLLTRSRSKVEVPRRSIHAGQFSSPSIHASFIRRHLPGNAALHMFRGFFDLISRPSELANKSTNCKLLASMVLAHYRKPFERR